MKKKLISKNKSWNLFNVILIKNIKHDDKERLKLLEERLQDETMYISKAFDSFDEAESYAIDTLEKNNEYFFSLINYCRYNYDTACDECVGDEEEMIIVAEYWSDKNSLFKEIYKKISLF